MKNLRRLLRNFPAKSSNLNIAEIKHELSEIKKETAKIVESKNIEQSQMLVFDSQSSIQKNVSVDENLLGDLLFYLRTQKIMSTLMMCRQIQKIEIKDNVAMLFSEESDLTELTTNEKHKVELDKFFKSKGLSFKIKEKTNEIDTIEILKEFFGDKLIVK